MDEHKEILQPIDPPTAPAFPTGGKELLFALAASLGSLLLCNFTMFGGMQLGFAIGTDLCILISAGYLLSRGHRLTLYSALLLGISLLIGAGFAYSDDGFVKFVMLLFLFVSINLGLTLLSGQQRHNPKGLMSLCDCFSTGFDHSFTSLGPAFSGLKQSIPRKNKGLNKAFSILRGLLVALPVVLILVALLMRADAAFEGLMDLLPEFDLSELPATLILGGTAFCLIYSQGVSLVHREKRQPAPRERKGISPVTVNTVLIAICLVYLVYLASQLAYFIGGLAGILPDGYTMAQYARRGFFEMAALCGINLLTIGLCIGLVEKAPATPILTRLLCLFIGGISVFFVATASGKMFLYMDAYGLTRLRLLTQVIMLWLGFSTVLVGIWILVPRFPYMKVILAVGLIIGALVLWADVDSVVARYNVDRYLSGSMESIDLSYLASLNRSAVPHVRRLSQEAPDESIRTQAQSLLSTIDRWKSDPQEDFRSWNYAKEVSEQWLSST